ncbi:MFS general substrate transporter [Sistotremastrum niveocremeum HHB9708]|uniref:MFS general substrate transporter n=1 Tax=Sistotremastrum niveocremeum HHB9708 TaxID=1314777 RepID=A0A165A4F7_9AGAM|nr:MFS general substrate transporter [Sistotremastrum niveocremeum HHB9708]
MGSELAHDEQTEDEFSHRPVSAYGLHKYRFVGLLSLALLNVGAGMNTTWFGPITNATAREFDISLSQVNWLGNIVNLVFLPMSLLSPPIFKRCGIRNTSLVAAAILTIGAWMRYAATATSLTPQSAYALLFLGQVLAGVSQPVFQVICPRFSEVWFDLRGRTTATMIVSLANPVGVAVAQILSPIFTSPKQSIFLFAIVSTGLMLPSLFMRNSPPKAPTHAGSLPFQGILITLRTLFSPGKYPHSTMDNQDRLDMLVITLGFGVYVAGINAFTLLSNQMLSPYGYSEDTAGFMGAALILSGLLSAAVTSPLFDRVLTHHLGITLRATTPFLAAAWIALIWAVRPHNAAPLYILFALIGAISITLLPVALELGCEITRNADAAAAILWFSGNLFSVVFVLVGNALTDGQDANPPFNMRRASIFNAVIIGSVTVLVYFLRAKQSRRELDEEMNLRSSDVGSVSVP